MTRAGPNATIPAAAERKSVPEKETEEKAPALQRRLGLGLVTLYGLGTMLGAGIYALVGEVAGMAGWQAPYAFVVAGALALLTALSFAELVSRHPLSAGEAVYVRHGFDAPRLGTVVGAIVAFSGIVSAGALANAFIGYLFEFVALPRDAAIIATVVGIGLIAAWGIAESVALAALITLIEALGLVIILWVGGQVAVADPEPLTRIVPLGDPSGLAGLMGAALIAFYAFIGFEDMVNVAEEVKDPRRTVPKALLVSLLAATLFYVAVMTVALAVLPPDVLAESEAPLADVYMQAVGHPATFIGLISLVAIVNGAIVQVIMASRVAYGMARQGWLPPMFGWVSGATHTPVLATAAVTLLVLILALAFDLSALAQATSLLLLAVFGLVNMALVNIKRRGDEPPGKLFRVPLAIPILGAAACTAMIAVQIARWLGW